MGPGSCWELFTVEPTLKCCEVEIMGFDRCRLPGVSARDMPYLLKKPGSLEQQFVHKVHLIRSRVAREVTEEPENPICSRVRSIPDEICATPTNNECTIRHDLVKWTSYNIMNSRRIERKQPVLMEGPRNCAEGQRRDAESTSDGSCACRRGLCVASKTHLHHTHAHVRRVSSSGT